MKKPGTVKRKMMSVFRLLTLDHRGETWSHVAEPAAMAMTTTSSSMRKSSASITLMRNARDPNHLWRVNLHEGAK